MAAAQPSGTVTFVFTDIEGSTRLLEQLGPDRYRDALAEHRRIVRHAFAKHEGYEVGTEGDSFFLAFPTAQAAVSALSEAMRALDGGPIRIRVGIHTGQPTLDPPNYIGIDVHRAARIMATAHGGQVVLSPSTVALLQPDNVALKHLGEHRLKDLSAPIALHQLHLDGLPHEFPPLKTLHHTNLPVPATPFLGREQELTQIVERLIHADTRLLTLTGPGGTGKTRLALQAAAEAVESFPNGVHWVALAPIRDPALLMPTIADALEIREISDEPLEATLARALFGKSILLVLDNLEHLLPDGARRLGDLIAACPTVRVLATSRERLQLAAEVSWPVPVLTREDSIALFIDRARTATPDFEPSDEVRAICETLDHLPLAIELAAVRTRSLSTTAILERLGRRLALLTSRAVDVDDRQRTLEATIGWSYDLLDADEQRTLRALSIFAGGSTLDAALRVADADLDVVERLLDKSLLRHRADDRADRYWMLETIREYAQDRLVEAGEFDAVFGSFLDWLQTIVGEIDAGWSDRDQLEWFKALERESANVMHGATTWVGDGGAERALRLVAAADEFFDARGPYGALVDLLEGATCQDPELNGRRVLLRIRLLYRLGRFRQASAAADEAIPELEWSPTLLGRLESFRAWCHVAEGEMERGVARAAVAVELGRSVDDKRGLALALNSLALAQLEAGRHVDGLASLREAQQLAEALGDRRNANLARANIALILLADRRPGDACDVMKTVLAEARAFGDAFGTCLALANLAIGLAVVGETTEARSSLREAFSLESLQFDHSLRVEGLLALALAAERDREPERAITLLAAGTGLAASSGYHVGSELQVYVTEHLAPLRDQEDLEEHWERGRSMPIDDAISLGLLEA